MNEAKLEPCLRCGQPVHLVAGRCKHCKADLVTLRAEAKAAARRAASEARAAAATPLRVATAPGQPTAPPAPSRSRSWRLWAAAAAVLLVGVLGGVAAQRVFAQRPPKQPATATAGLDQVASGADAQRRDLAADPGRPFTSPFMPDPADPRDPDPDPADPLGLPFDPFSLFGGPGGGALPGLPKGAQPRAIPRGQIPDVSQPEAFGQAAAAVICAKLAECGLVDDAAAMMCRMIADSLPLDDDLGQQVRSGQCRYDASAARRCLEMVGGLRCDGADPGQLLAMADQVASCARTLECQ